jgi:hypothetical protein
MGHKSYTGPRFLAKERTLAGPGIVAVLLTP